MTEFFPPHTVPRRVLSPHPLRRLTLSLPQMALLTGIGLRAWRSFSLTHGSSDSWIWVGGTFLAGTAFLFVMCAVHLGNFPLRKWTWRAPAFAVLEAGSEIVMSLALTALALEPLGSATAELGDWLPTAVRIFFFRLIGVLIFALVLAAIVSVLRRIILLADHRAHTAKAIHRATVEREAAVEAASKEGQ